jgi:hypothetical protein
LNKNLGVALALKSPIVSRGEEIATVTMGMGIDDLKNVREGKTAVGM